jgi:hypothetical protein
MALYSRYLRLLDLVRIDQLPETGAIGLDPKLKNPGI